MTTDIHSCSPFCTRPECVKARAVALAGEHGFPIGKVSGAIYPSGTEITAELTAMLNDNEQQVIQRLAEQTGVMPKECDGLHAGMCHASEVREAIANMQARVLQLERDIESCVAPLHLPFHPSQP